MKVKVVLWCKKQACKLQDAQAERLTNLQANKSGPGKLGPWIIWMRQIVFIQYKYIFIGESMSVGIGYILPTIGEDMFVEFMYWYGYVLDIFCQILGTIC